MRHLCDVIQGLQPVKKSFVPRTQLVLISRGYEIHEDSPRAQADEDTAGYP